MKSFLLLIVSLCLAQTTSAQTLAERSTPLDHLAGRWVMTGTIAGQEIVHDLDAEWILGGNYLYFHEIARSRIDGEYWLHRAQRKVRERSPICA